MSAFHPNLSLFIDPGTNIATKRPNFTDYEQAVHNPNRAGKVLIDGHHCISIAYQTTSTMSMISNQAEERSSDEQTSVSIKNQTQLFGEQGKNPHYNGQDKFKKADASSTIQNQIDSSRITPA